MWREWPKTHPYLFDGLFLVGFLGPMVALITYVYSPVDLFGVRPFSTMALHTASGFLLFFVGLALSVRDRSALRFFTETGFGSATFRRFIGPAVAAPLVIGWGVERLILHGLVGPSFGVALGAAVFVALSAAALVWAAHTHERLQQRMEAADRRRRAIEQRLLTLLDLSGDAVMMFDRHGRVVHANRGAEALLGWTKEELETLTLRQLIPPVYRERHEKLVDDFHTAPMTSSTQLNPLAMIAQHRNGHAVPVNITVTKHRFDDEVLTSAVVRDASDLARQFRSLRKEALIDPLTGIGNRRALDEVLGRPLAGGLRQGDLTAVLLFDLDHFKRINDSLGHETGDRILQAVAQKSLTCLRDTDRLYRYGGEEFVVVAEGTDRDGARRLAERLREGIGSVAVRNDDASITVTASLGIGLPRPDETDLHACCRRADAALYRAKQGGRDRVAIDDEELSG